MKSPNDQTPKRPGAPSKMENGRRRNVYIDDASWARAEALGNGNASDGIRIALQQPLDSQTVPSQALIDSPVLEPNEPGNKRWSRTLSGKSAVASGADSVIVLGGTTISKKTQAGLFKKAQLWREQNGFVGRGGIITLFQKKATGWASDMREPHRWEPGVLAVDEEGRTWITAGGDPQNGARRWEPVGVR